MVKRTEGETVTLTSAELVAMRKEIAELKAKVESHKPEPYDEIRKATIKNQQGNSQISIRHFTDHKKVALYHTNGYHVGKKIGPLHPGLLDYTFSAFKARGVILSPVCPSASEIEAYKKSDEYQKILEQKKNSKPHWFKKVDVEETQKIVANFAKALGISPSEAVQIKPQEQVMK